MNELHQIQPLSDDVLAQLFTTTHDAAEVNLYGLDDTTAQEIDEAQLLAETETLLDILEPMAFATSPCTSTTEATSTAQPASPNYSLLRVDSSSTLDSDSSTPASRTTTTKRNLSRDRRQSELAELRKQVVALEHAVRDTQERRAAAQESASSQSTRSLPLSERAAMVVVPKWQRIAKRQLESCERALAENKRLRCMLATQTQRAANLEEALCSWHNAAHTSAVAICSNSSNNVTNPIRPQLQLEHDDMVLLELLVSELDAAFAQVTNIFCSAGVDALDDTPLSRTCTRTEPLRSFIELVEREVSPFAFDVVRRVTQRCSEQQSRESSDCVEYCGSWTTSDTFAEKYRIARVSNGDTVDLVMLTVLKEFVTVDRVVVVWRSVFKCASHFPDAYVLERGSCVSSARASGDTVTTSVVQFEPKVSATPTAVVRADCDALTALVMSAYRDDMDELDALMDNMLLSESKVVRSA